MTAITSTWCSKRALPRLHHEWRHHCRARARWMLTPADDALDEVTKAIRAGILVAGPIPTSETPRQRTGWERLREFRDRQLGFARETGRSLQRKLFRNLGDRRSADRRQAHEAPPRAVRFNERDMLVRTPFGWVLAPLEDEVLLTYLVDGGALEPGTTKVLTALVREGDTVVDVGAHLGLMTIPAALRAGATGRVISFEPLPRLVQLLRRNVALNDVADRVHIEAKACGENRGAALLHVGAVLGHSSLLPLDDERSVLEVATCPVDDVVPAGCPVAVVKIDAEGFELQVWRSMRRVRSESRDLAVIVEFGPSHLRRSGVSITDWLAEFYDDGFTAYEINELDGRCGPVRSKGLEKVNSVNLVFLRRPTFRYPGIEFV